MKLSQLIDRVIRADEMYMSKWEAGGRCILYTRSFITVAFEEDSLTTKLPLDQMEVTNIYFFQTMK